jgi:endonuclease/exonuclease/phosphatase family metal-dependent hydrolase
MFSSGAKRGQWICAWLAVLTLFMGGIRPLAAADAPEEKFPGQPVSRTTNTLRVMTYNLKYASQEGANAWPDRLPIMVECLKGLEIDLFGTQEGVYEQLKDLARALPSYEWIGLGRDGGSHGEFMAIFYRKDRFDPLEIEHFWLSDTPSVIGSTTWGHSNRRMVTWVRFKDLLLQKEFYFWNTHLDHANQQAREKAAALIRSRVEKLNRKLPVILTGDFNAAGRDNKAYDILVPDTFSDTWFMARERQGEGLGTFNGFRRIPRDNRRIDWILLQGEAEVLSSKIVTFARDGQFPSDHFPVVAELKW